MSQLINNVKMDGITNKMPNFVHYNVKLQQINHNDYGYIN
jgi:hypothetical protein